MSFRAPLFFTSCLLFLSACTTNSGPKGKQYSIRFNPAGSTALTYKIISTTKTVLNSGGRNLINRSDTTRFKDSYLLTKFNDSLYHIKKLVADPVAYQHENNGGNDDRFARTGRLLEKSYMEFDVSTAGVVSGLEGISVLNQKLQSLSDEKPGDFRAAYELGLKNQLSDFVTQIQLDMIFNIYPPGPVGLHDTWIKKRHEANDSSVEYDDLFKLESIDNNYYNFSFVSKYHFSKSNELFSSVPPIQCDVENHGTVQIEISSGKVTRMELRSKTVGNQPGILSNGILNKEEISYFTLLPK